MSIKRDILERIRGYYPSYTFDFDGHTITIGKPGTPWNLFITLEICDTDTGGFMGMAPNGFYSGPMRRSYTLDKDVFFSIEAMINGLGKLMNVGGPLPNVHTRYEGHTWNIVTVAKESPKKFILWMRCDCGVGLQQWNELRQNNALYEGPSIHVVDRKEAAHAETV